MDVFAFGMTVFELLTMRPPFDDAPQRNTNILHKLVREGKRPLLSEKVPNHYYHVLTIAHYTTGGSVTSSNTRYDADVLGT